MGRESELVSRQEAAQENFVKNLLRVAREYFLWLLLLPTIMFFSGATSNQLVLIANHDKFPVMVNAVKLAEFEKDSDDSLPDGMIDDTHCIMTDKTHLNALADIFDGHDAVYSVGDLLIISGEKTETTLPFIWIALIIYKEAQRKEA